MERKLFIATSAILLMLGVLMVHSASGTSRPSEIDEIHLTKHLVFGSIGCLLATIAGFLPVRFWRGMAPICFICTAILLVMVLLPGVGSVVKGARRWFRFGGFSIQPSELAKIAVPLMVCWLAERHREVFGEWLRGGLGMVWPLIIVVPLILKQPDLGTSLFVALGGGIALFLCGWPVRYFVIGVTAATPVIVIGVLHKSYQLRRVEDFLATWHDWKQAPYHLKQSLVTLAGGGTWGTGIGRGQQKLSFLPEAHTDFIFAVIGEELGLIGVIGVLILWLVMFGCGLRMVNRLPARTFAYAAACTLLTEVLLQAAINIAVVTALVPPKGIPHPLLSYGGSNLVVTLSALGIVFGLTRDANQERRELTPANGKCVPIEEVLLNSVARGESEPTDETSGRFK